MSGKIVTDVSITINTKKVISQLEQQIKLAADAIGQTAEGYAKSNCPVDTGRLRNSISNAVDDKESKDETTIYIGTNVEYAPAVEFRDISHKTGRAHFLRDAATTHGEEYKKITEAALKDE